MKNSNKTSWHELWHELHQFGAFSCNSETVPNAPERKETPQNMSLGSNSVDRERSLRKIMTRLRGTKFYINYTSLARFTPSFVQ